MSCLEMLEGVWWELGGGWGCTGCPQLLPGTGEAAGGRRLCTGSWELGPVAAGECLGSVGLGRPSPLPSAC